MRYAKVINGLYHNDTLCSYVPETSCHRRKTLDHCVDRSYCLVENGWYNLEPDCDGNSYYTQLEFSCQPAYYMCEKKSIKNVFSALIYSPSFPNLYRSDKTETCFLIVHLPKNYHAEITLDFFDLPNLPECFGDFLEIQEYIQEPIEKKLKRSSSSSKIGFDESDLLTSKNYTNKYSHLSKGIGNLTKTQKKKNATGKNLKLKSQKQQYNPQQDNKWSNVGVLCGRKKEGIKYLARSDIISFKFKLLEQGHAILGSSFNQTANLGFKIFIQGNSFFNHTLN